MSCLLPSVHTPPHHQPHRIHLSQNPAHPCPKMYFLKARTTLLAHSIHMAVPLGLTLLIQSYLPSWSVSPLGAQTMFPASLNHSTGLNSKAAPTPPSPPTLPTAHLSFQPTQTSPSFFLLWHLCAFAHAVPHPSICFLPHVQNLAHSSRPSIIQ